MRFWPLTSRGSGTAILGAVFLLVAQIVGIPALIPVGLLLLTIVALAAASLYLVRRSDDLVRAFTPDVVPVGGTATATIRLHTRTTLPTTTGTWRDAVPESLRAVAGGPLPPTASALRAGPDPVTLRYRVTAVRRGVATAGPLTIVVTDPFGLARLRRIVRETTELTVTPAIVDLAALDDLPGAIGGSRHSRTDPLGQGSDNLIPRPYAPGDSMRRVHWRASAHRDELMVRQEEQETTPEAVVVLDRGTHRYPRAAARTPGEDPGFETAVIACVSAVDRLVREGYHVAVIDAAGAPLCAPVDGGDRAGVDAACVALAPLVARREDPLDGLAHVFGGIPTGPLVLVTGGLGDEDAEALARLARLSPLAVLLTTGTMPADAARIAGEGWRVAAIAPGEDVAGAWTRATAASGGRADG